MQPVKHPSHNFIYRGPQPGIGDLSCQRVSEDGMSAVYSHWKPDEQELQALIAGGSVVLGIHGMEPIPPVSVEVAEDWDENVG